MTMNDTQQLAFQINFLQMALVFSTTIVAILAIKTVISKVVRALCDRKARALDSDEPSTSS
jgi:hypothetical protein